MQGIEILNETKIHLPPMWCVIGFVICLGLLIILLKISDDTFGITDTILTALACVATIGAVVFLIVGFSNCDTVRQYEAVIHDDVSIEEVYDKYEVIERDGKKWVLQDKVGD